MREVQDIATATDVSCLSVPLSHGLTRLYCAKTAERIEILFGLNTLGGLRSIVLDGSPDPPQRGGGELGKILPIV